MGTNFLQNKQKTQNYTKTKKLPEVTSEQWGGMLLGSCQPKQPL